MVARLGGVEGGEVDVFADAQAFGDGDEGEFVEARGNFDTVGDDEIEVRPLAVTHVDCNTRDAPSSAKHLAHGGAHALGVEHVRKTHANFIDGADENRTLAKKNGLRALFHLGFERLEEEHERNGDKGRVEAHRVEASKDRDEQIEDRGEARGEERRHKEAPREIVEVCDALADEGLGEHEEKHDAQRSADGRQVHAHERQEVGEREKHREHAGEGCKPHAFAKGPRRAGFTAPCKRDEAGGDKQNQVRVEHTKGPWPLLVRRELERHHREDCRRGELGHTRAFATVAWRYDLVEDA